MSRPTDDARENPIRSVLLASYENAHKRVRLWWGAEKSYFVSEHWAETGRGYVEYRVLSFRNFAMARSEYDVACVGAELLEQFEVSRRSASGGAR